jgi:hypothetical protein
VSATERTHCKIRTASARSAEGSDRSATATQADAASSATTDVDAPTTTASARAATTSATAASPGRVSVGDQRRGSDEQNDRNTDGRPDYGALDPHGAALPGLLNDFWDPFLR